MRTSLSVHAFVSKDHLPFSAVDYSKLKYGSDIVAKQFGYELADKFWEFHSTDLLANRCVVIPSPYNHVKNAASIMTEHFVDRINHLLVMNNGNHVETSIIHRKVSYTNDYGRLSMADRQKLISQDSFYMNRKFLKGKTLIFLDDVRITGTHEHKLVEILKKERMENDCFFLYYATYLNGGSGCDIEAWLNTAGIQNSTEYVALTQEPNHHLIVRPVKYMLRMQPLDFERLLQRIPSDNFKMKFYHACIGEGYYCLPDFQANFNMLANHVSNIHKADTSE